MNCACWPQKYCRRSGRVAVKISIVTDEISADPETALELGSEWGVHDFELRGFFTDRVPRFSAYQKQHLRDVLEEHQARIIAISPGLFKWAAPPERADRLPLGWMEQGAYAAWDANWRMVDTHLNELLPASLEYANELGARLVVTFGFDRGGRPPGPAPEEVLNILCKAAERAEGAGIQLVLENEDGFWADTGARTAELIRAVNQPALAVNWDPGNAFSAGDEPYPEGYRHVAGLVCHVHFKDARRARNGSVQQVVGGDIDWAGQIRALAADEYTGFVSVETHMRPKVQSGRASLSRLRGLIQAAETAS
jgi:sugar phosphate isomerase/epimerase